MIGGSVGIGTTSPSAKLDVSGNIKATNISITDNTNTSIGNFTIGLFNSTCAGFRAGKEGGWILSCGS